jgi:hypothetical protein
MQIAWFESTVASVVTCRFSHTKSLAVSHTQVTLVEVAWFNHVEWTSVTSAHKDRWYFFLFLPPLFGGSDSNGDSQFLTPYKARGALNRLNELVSYPILYICHLYRLIGPTISYVVIPVPHYNTLCYDSPNLSLITVINGLVMHYMP